MNNTIDKNKFIRDLIYEETGHTFAGKCIWNELHKLVKEQCYIDGSYLLEGYDDSFYQFTYDVDVKFTYEKEVDRTYTDIILNAIILEDKRYNETFYVKVKGN